MNLEQCTAVVSAWQWATGAAWLIIVWLGLCSVMRSRMKQ